MFAYSRRFCIVVASLLATTPAILTQDVGKEPVGFQIQFHGVLEKGVYAGYDLDIRFHGATEDWEYTRDYGIYPYSPQRACKAFQSFMATAKIETEKVGDTGFVIVGYRTPDGKLNRVKSVKITSRGDTTVDKMPTIKDTRPKA